MLMDLSKIYEKSRSQNKLYRCLDDETIAHSETGFGLCYGRNAGLTIALKRTKR